MFLSPDVSWEPTEGVAVDYQSKEFFDNLISINFANQKTIRSEIATADLQRHRQMYQFICCYYKLSISWVNIQHKHHRRGKIGITMPSIRRKKKIKQKRLRLEHVLRHACQWQQQKLLIRETQSILKLTSNSPTQRVNEILIEFTAGIIGANNLSKKRV